MFHNGTRNIVILTGFLAKTETPGVRRLYQNVAALTYIPVLVSEGDQTPDMAPVDLSGPLVFDGAEPAVRGDFIGAASLQSIRAATNFMKVGDRTKLPILDFAPLDPEKISFNNGKESSQKVLVLKDDILSQLSEGPSTWGLVGMDVMAGWVREGVEAPSKNRLMNRLILSGLPGGVGPLVDDDDRSFRAMTFDVGPTSESSIEARLYHDMRFWSSATRIVASTVSPITLAGTLRCKFDKDRAERFSYIDTLDVYAASGEDMPDGVPAWMIERVRDTQRRRSVNLEPANLA